MRIQHNIMAMSAYRNYTNNVSAMKKNLEKLSSGYKINRAGDDAAGLAISEKMRAQITGLETAQKNAKDGISLVQTAEGALTEVHDMLNRMVELATMSANGTYDNETDRAQLQKEMDQLRSEIDRIADSANFNGINLLDGSMQASKTLSQKEILDMIPELAENQNEGGIVSAGTKLEGTIVESNGGAAVKTSFEISLEGLKDLKAVEDDVFNLKVGSDTMSVTLTADETYDAKKLATAIASANATVTIGNGQFNVTAEDGVLKFEAVADGGKLDKSASVTWELTNATTSPVTPYSTMDLDGGFIVYEAGNQTTVTGTAGTAITAQEASSATAAVYEFDLSATPTGSLNGKKIDGEAITWKTDLNTTMTSFVASYNAANKDYKASYANGKLTLTANSAGPVETAPTASVPGADKTLVAAVSTAGAAASGETAAVTAVYKFDLSATATGSLDGKTVNGVTISWTTDLDTTMTSVAAAISAADGSKYDASWDSSNQALVLTAKNPGVVAEADVPTTTLKGPGDAIEATEKNKGANAAQAIKADASGLTSASIASAAGSATGKVTVELNSETKKLDLKVGDEVIGSSTVTVNGTVTSFTFSDGAETNPTNFGTITFDNAPETTDTISFETGLSVTSGSTNPEETEAVAAATFSPAAASAIFSSHTAAVGTTTAATIQSAIRGLGTVTVPVSSMGVSASVAGPQLDLSAVTVAATDSLEDIAEKIANVAKTAFEAWNRDNPDSEQVFKGIKITSDAAGENILYTTEDFATQSEEGGGDGFYIWPITAERTTPDAPTVKTHGVINRGIQNPVDASGIPSDNLANTVVDFGAKDAWTDGSEIKIGDETYTVAIGKDSAYKNAKNVVDLTDAVKDGKVDANVAAQKLAVAANGNKTFSVGHDGKGHTTLQQRESVKKTTDMETREGIASYLGLKTANLDKSGNAVKGLTLQIGDTADSYNKLTVDIQDMHTAALGLDSIKISDQDSASEAIKAIKAAINQVSDVRGTLGATQNRLDHTINNLSVMTENIQDAESTIRDVDVAEEMMAYTKNNILIQSAQAMLAQANQVPQGVLQLLG